MVRLKKFFRRKLIKTKMIRKAFVRNLKITRILRNNKNFKKHLLKYRKGMIFIHIGKCGGSTISKELKKKKINFSIVHVQKPIFYSNKKYTIVLRNPIKRFISAFNWRYKLVCDDKIKGTKIERNILKKYGTVNNLAENLYNSKGILKKEYLHIEHIRQNINYYIGDFLKKCNKKNIRAVIATETLNEDLKNKFNINVKAHCKNNDEKYDKYISELGYKNLKKHLKKDYECIKKLYKMGVISKEKYEILSK